MKLYNNLKSPIVFFSVVLILGGVGSVIFSFAPIIGGLLIFVGVIGSILSLLSSETKNKQGDYLFEAQAILFARQGVGNVYTEAVKVELKKTGSCKNAIQLFLKSLEIEPTNHDARAMICIFLVLNLSSYKWLKISSKMDGDEGMLLLATNLIKGGLQLYPKSHVFHDARGIIYDIEGKHEDARKEFYTSGKLRKDPYQHLLIATSWHMSGNHNNALLEMEKAHKKGANGWLFDFYYGTSLNAIGNYEESLEYLKKTIKHTGLKAEPLHEISDSYYSIGNFLKASKYKALTGLSIILVAPRTGSKYLIEAFILLLFGIIYNISKILWKITKYIPILRSIQLKVIPPYEPEFSTGNFLMEKKHYLAAENLYLRASKVVPKWGKLHSNLSACSAKQGKKTEAIYHINRAISLEPNNEVYKWNKKQFEKEGEFRIRSINSI